ncbi:TonB-dependent receptor [Terracidiphilus gabretensis]|uniref:TonB-dependent receptor n=1 Tax=Terracidiphilus gabretensis TaxID=1577687 RepID=UPI00071B5EEF|nr:TonB-dependent receptor [Terracidiphilus gabretensis]
MRTFLARLGTLATLCAIFSIPLAIHAQGYGSISGAVTDSTGAVIPNAQITAVQVGTGTTLKTVSGGAGTYVFPSVPPAAYTISVSAQGFESFQQTNVVLQADQAATVNIALKIGSSATTITVTTAPPQVDTTTGTLSQVIGTEQVNDLPLITRNAAALTMLVPGVVTAPSANIDQGQTKTFPALAVVTINGSRANQTNYMLDGGNNVDEYTNVNAPFPFPDVIQEFSVQTSNYAAEYGQNAGGVVNIVTKSGTNKFHGDAFEYVRNRVFNAADYFSYVNGVKTQDFLKRNQFGGTVNGPIWHDRTFFAFGIQATRFRNKANGGTATLPTPAQLAGTFTGMPTATAIKNPQTLTPYPCTPDGSTYTCQVNPSDYNSASLKLLTYLPTISGDDGQLTYFKPVSQNFIEYFGRVDHQLTSKDHLWGHYYYNRFDAQGVLDPTNLLTYSDEASIRYHSALLAETHTFSPNLLNNLNVSYQIEDASRGPLPGAPDMNDLGVNIWQPAFKQINQICIGGGSTSCGGGALVNIGDNPAATFRRNNYTLAEDLSWVKGAHTFGFGFHGEMAKVDIDNQYEQPGQFFFDTSTTDASPMADFLLGGLLHINQASGQYFNNRYKVTGYYAQDSWKISRRLTLDLGVRYEPFLPMDEIKGRQGMFSEAAWSAVQVSTTHPTAPAGLLFPGDQGFVHNMLNGVYNHFMPRLGFAWDVFGTGRTSVRGGAGQFYDSRLPGVFDNIFANAVPFVASVGYSYSPTNLGVFTDPYANVPGGNIFPAPQPPPANYFTNANYQAQGFSTFLPNQFRVPVTYAWNLSVEQQYTNTLSSRIAYAGLQSEHQENPMDINPIWNQGPNVGHRIYASANPAQNFTSALAAVDTGGIATYHSLQASLRQTYHHGLSANFNYTWSKAIDDNTWGSSVTAVVPGSSYVLPIYEPNFKRLDHGRSDYDHRNVISASYLWTFPKWTGGNAISRYIVNGWQTTGVIWYHTGDPLTVTGSNVDGTGLGRDRAIWNGSNPYGGAACAATTAVCKNWLNPASFSVNPSYTVANPLDLTYGNVVKGTFTGPNYTDWDTSASRYFTFTERARLEFKAEFFNVLNHENFGDPANSVTSSSLGRITASAVSAVSGSQGTYRTGQLSLKLVF